MAGGPKQGAERAVGYADFLFPQYQLPEPWTWRPAFLDYLYIALTRASSFAPADSLIMTTRAKAMMALQSIISLGVILIVAARAISILHWRPKRFFELAVLSSISPQTLAVVL